LYWLFSIQDDDDKTEHGTRGTSLAVKQSTLPELQADPPLKPLRALAGEPSQALAEAPHAAAGPAGMSEEEQLQLVRPYLHPGYMQNMIYHVTYQM
jgi:hypothetical protein